MSWSNPLVSSQHTMVAKSLILLECDPLWILCRQIYMLCLQSNYFLQLEYRYICDWREISLSTSTEYHVNGDIVRTGNFENLHRTRNIIYFHSFFCLTLLFLRCFFIRKVGVNDFLWLQKMLVPVRTQYLSKNVSNFLILETRKALLRRKG